jgi:hypothetical protein
LKPLLIFKGALWRDLKVVPLKARERKGLYSLLKNSDFGGAAFQHCDKVLALN